MLNNFPYTNFHELNLDWILETTKKAIEKAENVEAKTTELTEDTSELVTNYDYLSRRVSGLSADLSVYSNRFPFSGEGGTHHLVGEVYSRYVNYDSVFMGEAQEYLNPPFVKNVLYRTTDRYMDSRGNFLAVYKIRLENNNIPGLAERDSIVLPINPENAEINWGREGMHGQPHVPHTAIITDIKVMFEKNTSNETYNYDTDTYEFFPVIGTDGYCQTVNIKAYIYRHLNSAEVNIMNLSTGGALAGGKCSAIVSIAFPEENDL